MAAFGDVWTIAGNGPHRSKIPQDSVVNRGSLDSGLRRNDGCSKGPDLGAGDLLGTKMADGEGMILEEEADEGGGEAEEEEEAEDVRDGGDEDGGGDGGVESQTAEEEGYAGASESGDDHVAQHGEA